MPLRFLVFALLAIAAGVPAAAQSSCPNGTPSADDADGDCVPDAIERTGYDAQLRACTPGTSGCFVTDPLTWSSDGDPYSDYQEATGVNMESAVEAPYNHPLVAAMPMIDVELVGYTYTPEAEITDASGGSRTDSESETYSVEVTVGASYEFGPTGGATVSGSVTGGYSRETNTTNEVNWETATTTNNALAARLALTVRARNRGGASAQDVTPTFNLSIGGELVATIRPDGPLPSGNDNLLGPGATTDEVVIRTDQNGDPIFVSLPQLRRLRTGAPVELRVVNLDATVIRWEAGTNNWSCGDPCRWGPFIQQVEARTTRLLIDFGFSGDPDIDPDELQGPFRGSPFDYRVYTGSPSPPPDGTSAGVTLRDALGFLGLANPTGSGFSILDRSFPSQWFAQEGPLRDSDGFDFREAFERDVPGGVWPRDLLSYVLPRRTELLLASPAPGAAGPVVPLRRLRRDLREVSLAAQPRGSIAVAGATAHLFVQGEERVVEMVRQPGTDEFRLPNPTALPISPSSSYAVVTDAAGNTARVAFEPTGAVAASCADLPEAAFQRPGFFEPPSYGGLRGTTILFVDGDLGTPATAFCADRSADGTYYWAPQEAGLGADVQFREVAVLDAARRVVVGNGVVARTEDGGATWTRVTDGVPPGTFWLGLAFREGGTPGAEVGVAVSSQGRIIRTDDGGQSWDEATVDGGGVYLEAVDYAGGETWVAVGATLIRRSDDDGRSWRSQSLLAVDAQGAPVSRPAVKTLTAVEFISATEGVVGDAEMADGVGRIYATLDGGQTWRETAAYTGHNDIAYNGRDRWAIVGDQGIWVQDDLLRPGSKRQVLPANGGRFWNVDFGSPDVGVAVDLTESRRIVRTGDGGETWEPTGGYPGPVQPGTQRLIGVDLLDENVGAVAGYESLLGATDSGGGFPTYVGGPPVDKAPDAPQPLDGAAVTLAAPAPNPVRQSARIAYALAEKGTVRLSLIDMLGREVAVLAAGPRLAGEHESRLDASTLASGVYVVRLATAAGAAARTVTVVR